MIFETREATCAGSTSTKVKKLQTWLSRGVLIAATLTAIPALGAATRAAEVPVKVVKTAAAAHASAAQPGLIPPALLIKSETIDPKVLGLALQATTCATQQGVVGRPATLTVIDYSRPSTKPRLWVVDLATGVVLFEELVAHGQGSGDNLATKFSDEPDSHQSSLGLFVTGETYTGKHGYSLRLQGLEDGVNSRALERAIVVHAADYVSPGTVSALGRLGRSWGCPALGRNVAKRVIDTIKDGSLIFSYYPDKAWLSGSKFLSTGCGGTQPSAT
jgi:hypothetical protein